jgi:hypothetical protein
LKSTYEFFAQPTDAKVTGAEAAAMLRAVFNLFQLWGVADAQAKILLGEPSTSTFYRWKRGEIGVIPLKSAPPPGTAVQPPRGGESS